MEQTDGMWVRYGPTLSSILGSGDSNSRRHRCGSWWNRQISVHLAHQGSLTMWTHSQALWSNSGFMDTGWSGFTNPSLARVLNAVIAHYPWQSPSRVTRKRGTRRIHTGGFLAATEEARFPDLCRAGREPEFIPEVRKRGVPT